MKEESRRKGVAAVKFLLGFRLMSRYEKEILIVYALGKRMIQHYDGYGYVIARTDPLVLDFIRVIKTYCESPLKYFERNLYRSLIKVVRGNGSTWGLLNQSGN